ncbi:MAG: cupin domain-containing protein [Cyclobacteriaceae bacterium]
MQTKTWSKHKIGSIDEERIQKGGPYLSFINRETLKTGLYVLPKGTVDGQTPHDLDEVYYIIEGRSKFFADGDTMDVEAGDVLFVAAKKEHRFSDIQEDLKILVFFSEARP